MPIIDREWRKLSAKDSARIKCQGHHQGGQCSMNAQATWAMRVKPITQSASSFFYTCDAGRGTFEAYDQTVERLFSRD